MLPLRIRHVVPLALILALLAAIVPGHQGRVAAKPAAVGSPALYITNSGAVQTSLNTWSVTLPSGNASALQVTGVNLTPGAQYTVVTNMNAPGQTGTADASGNFTNYFPVGTNPTRTYTVQASDNKGDFIPPITVNLTVSGTGGTGTGSCSGVPSGASVFVSPTTATPNSTITITGSGFTPNAGIIIYLVGTTTALSNGTFSFSYVLPPTTPAGSYTITACDSTHVGSATLLVSGTSGTSASLSASPTNLIVGQTIALTGAGFNTSGSVTLSGSGIASTTVALNSAGTFSASVPTLTNTASGTYVITASDGTHSGTATIQLTNPYGTFLTATPSNVNAGNQITFTGSGFSGNPALAVILSGTGFSTVYPTQTTLGQFSQTVTIASGTPAGTYTITANDGTKSATTQITVGTVRTSGVTLSVTPSNPTAGQPVTVSGSGFTANSAVSIVGAGGSASATANASGAFTVSMNIPTTTGVNTYTVTATDSAGRVGIYTVRVGATGISIVPSATSTTAGQAITFTGTGFTAGEQVTVSLANPSTPQTAIAGTTQTVVANANGAISGTYTVPTSTAAGSYDLLALGQTSLVETTADLSIAALVPTATSTPVVVPTATPVPAPLPSVSSASSTTFFAEGYTGTAAVNGKATFGEKLYLYNPGSAPSAVTTTYYIYANGATTPTTVTANDTVSPGSTIVRNVNSDVGPDKFVSIEVQSTTGVVAETVITRVRADGTTLDTGSSLGSPSLQQNWYLAEGYTGATIQEYLTLFNPGSSAANAQVSYLPSNTPAPAPQAVTVPARGRVTINVRAVYNKLVVHGSRNVAISVTSSAPIAVDRSMYWGDGSGSAKYGYSLGPAISSGKTSQSFSFLPTEGGSQSFVTVLNPTTSNASATLSLRSIGGSVLTSSTASIPAGQRYTFVVPSLLRGDNGAIVGALTSTQPVVAEAGLYFGGSPNIGRHPGLVVQGSVGSNMGARAMVNPGGAQLRLYNPGNTTERVQVTLGSGSGASIAYDSTLPSNLARTITLPPGTDPRGVLVLASGTVEAVLINGGDGFATAWGGNLN